ncbi:MAG: ATP-dependent Clp protease adaptor ClpS [Chitinophagaceae bacterium]
MLPLIYLLLSLSNQYANMGPANSLASPEIDQVLEISLDQEQTCHLVVWNDEINTFDWVITSLMEICDHTHEQAEQSALLIHYHGKHAVKIGEYQRLKPMCEALTDRGINATVETFA